MSSSNGFDREWLKALDHDFVPESNILPDVECLADGEYEVEVNSAQNREPSGYLIIEMACTVISKGSASGRKFKHSIFISNQDSANRAGAELAKLGFDTHLWNEEHKRSFSTEIFKVFGVLPGLRFKAKKRTSKSKGKTYHNLDILARIPGDGKPETLGPKELNATNEFNLF